MVTLVVIVQNMHLPVAVATAAASSVNPRFAGQEGGAGQARCYISQLCTLEIHKQQRNYSLFV